MPRTTKRKRTVKKKVARKKPKRKATKAQLVTKLVKETQQLQKAGYSKEEILLIVASSIGGIALLTGIGLGGAALAKRMKKSPAQYFRDRNDRINAARDERIKERVALLRNLDRFKKSSVGIDDRLAMPGYISQEYQKDFDNNWRKEHKAEPGFLKLQARFRGKRARAEKFEELQKKFNEDPDSTTPEEKRWLRNYLRMKFGRKKRKRKRKVKKRKRKRKVKRKRKKRKFGRKVSKKPSAALRRMCKRLKVRLTVKRGKKRVYKSEKVLKKQCKTAMKRKK